MNYYYYNICKLKETEEILLNSMKDLNDYYDKKSSKWY